MNPALIQIRACKYLYLDQISEPSDNELRITVVEAVIGARTEPAEFGDDPVLRAMLTDASPIVTSPDSKVFEICWPS